MGQDKLVKEPILSVIVPCFNEARSLRSLLERFSMAIGDRSVELLLVDNGSTDETAAVLAEQLGQPRFRFARSVKVERNIGYGHGIMRGLREARGTWLAFTHADMQCDPADVIRGFDCLQSQPNPEGILVKGRRLGRPWPDRMLTIGMQIAATALLRTVLTDINAQPKVFHRRLLSKLTTPPVDFNLDAYVLYAAKRAGLRILTVPVTFGPRHYGVSKWAFSLPSKIRHINYSFAFLCRLGFSRDSTSGT